MTPESLLKNLDAFSTNSVECDHKTSNLSESTTTTVNTAPTLFESLESPHPLVAPAAETSIRPSATRSPMIQMLDKDGEEDKEVESKQLFIEPEYSFETSRQKTSLKILLPLVVRRVVYWSILCHP